MRLKRAERPPAEFWADFERELRQKQLAALVQRKSWWHELAAAGSRFGWLRLPLGATAILALTFFSIRHYSRSGGDRSNAGVNVANQPVAPASMQPLDEARRGAEPVPVRDRTPAANAVAGDAKGAVLTAEAAPAVPPPVSGWRPSPASVSEDPIRAEVVTPASRMAATNLAMATVIGSDLVDAIARPRGFDEGALSGLRPHRAAEVLPTATAVAEPRRTRLLASLGSGGAYAPEPSVPEHARRSVTRYLAQEGWDRPNSRLEAEGDRLSIKF